MRERIEITQALFLPLYNLCTIIVCIKPTKYILRNTGLEEAQAGIKIAGRNINNLLMKVYVLVRMLLCVHQRTVCCHFTR